MVRLVGNFFDDDLFLDIDYERWINILTERKPETETEKLKLYHKSVSPIWYECCHQSLPIILSTNHSHKYRHQFDNNCNQNLSPKYSPPINHRNIATNLIIVATKISYQNILHQSLTDKYRHQFDNNCNQNLAPKYSPPINHRNIATNLIIISTKISYQNILHQSITEIMPPIW